jgi:hypothetical protein
MLHRASILDRVHVRATPSVAVMVFKTIRGGRFLISLMNLVAARAATALACCDDDDDDA